MWVTALVADATNLPPAPSTFFLISSLSRGWPLVACTQNTHSARAVVGSFGFSSTARCAASLASSSADRLPWRSCTHSLDALLSLRSDLGTATFENLNLSRYGSPVSSGIEKPTRLASKVRYWQKENSSTLCPHLYSPSAKESGLAHAHFGQSWGTPWSMMSARRGITVVSLPLLSTLLYASTSLIVGVGTFLRAARIAQSLSLCTFCAFSSRDSSVGSSFLTSSGSSSSSLSLATAFLPLPFLALIFFPLA
mmetsp:Transcript_52906/g.129201  ORF Transcript_52906/g.129201 Transcript_52906/m.129201 type:complete len:252 (-) Transcript_52906:793-1548(-)